MGETTEAPRSRVRRIAEHGWTKVVSVVVTAAVGAFLSDWHARSEARADAVQAAVQTKTTAEAGYTAQRGAVSDLQVLLQQILLSQARLEADVEALKRAERARHPARGRVAAVRAAEIGVIAIQPPEGPPVPAAPRATDILGQAVREGKLEQLPATLDAAQRAPSAK